MRRMPQDVIRFTMIACVTTLLLGVGLLFAQIEPPPPAQEQATDRDAALQRASHLRAEAAAHREMAKEFTAHRAASRGERRWNARVIELCRQYAADAETAAAVYEALAAQDSGSPVSKQPMNAAEHSITAPPSTAAEYEARATEYTARAAEYRAEADRHAAMIRRDPINVQPNRGASPPRPVIFESPRARDMREHCIEIVRQSTDLARDADDIAKHYALRARQLAPPK